MEGADATPKSHRAPTAGRKAEKKKAKRNDGSGVQRNPKAFTFKSAARAARSVRRSLDLKEKRHHVPVVDRTPLEPPPVLVAVVGPPRVGKSTLIRGLVKHLTKESVTEHSGPVTVVSGESPFPDCLDRPELSVVFVLQERSAD